MGVGPVAVISLAEACARVIEARRLLLDEIDPIGQRTAQPAAKVVCGKNFADCAEAYIEAPQAEWSNAKHAGQGQAMLTTYAYPVFAATPVAAIDLDLKVTGSVQERGGVGFRASTTAGGRGAITGRDDSGE